MRIDQNGVNANVGKSPVEEKNESESEGKMKGVSVKQRAEMFESGIKRGGGQAQVANQKRKVKPSVPPKPDHLKAAGGGRNENDGQLLKVEQIRFEMERDFWAIVSTDADLATNASEVNLKDKREKLISIIDKGYEKRCKKALENLVSGGASVHQDAFKECIDGLEKEFNSIFNGDQEQINRKVDEKLRQAEEEFEAVCEKKRNL